MGDEDGEDETREEGDAAEHPRGVPGPSAACGEQGRQERGKQKEDKTEPGPNSPLQGSQQ